ncbi:hypothetical protein PIB30_037938 [Stylosanthes scabra]|uniref:Uncharacterized protein n=1 Tax=Stylosanthes scabra TaxID=79078 RepID=A0ABU6UE28_9FABA|nr:hypothetical protein [Stylosanthes scabra]
MASSSPLSYFRWNVASFGLLVQIRIWYFLRLPLRTLALYFYPLNMRFLTDGANVKVGSLNDYPKDFYWGAKPQ